MAPAAAVVLSGMLPSAALAQDYTQGSLTGQVIDGEGNPVAGAQVTIRSQAQGVTRTVTTGEDGEFRAAALQPGAYAVTIAAPGFNSFSDDAVSVRLGGESNFNFTLAREGDVEEVVVRATRADPQLDFAQTTTGVTVDVADLVKQVPVARNITAVTLLAPSAVPSDTAFAVSSAQLQAPAAVSGASAGENAYFVNGLNTTNFINGLGGAGVPFDFYQTVETKTGGYQAEFGRAIGAVVNAVTKAGSNDFTFAIRGQMTPDRFRSDSPDTYLQDFSQSSGEDNVLTFEAGGPIIRDRLFFYGLVSFNETTNTSATGNAGLNNPSQTQTQTGVFNTDSTNDPFYGLKLDGYITPTQHLEFTYFDTSRERTREVRQYNPSTNVISPNITDTQTLRLGGENYVARYTGSFTDWLTVSGAYGRSETDQANTNFLFNIPRVQNANGSNAGVQSATASTFPFLAEREFFRADVDLFFDFIGEHHVRVGYDRENTTLTEFSVRNGGANFQYQTATATNTLGLAAGQEYLTRRVFISGGGFEGRNEALYIQDAWDLTDRLSLQLGVREDKFSVSSPLGDEAVAFDGEIAARLGFTFDPTGDRRSKIFGFYGRYYLPVASNTSFRVFAPAIDFTEFFRPVGGGLTFGARDPVTGLPAAGLGPQITGAASLAPCPATVPSIAPPGTVACSVRNNGTALPPETYVASNLGSTYEDEWILGYEHRLENDIRLGATFRYRKLGRVSEDTLLDQGVLAYCARKNIAGCADLGYGEQIFYNIINPGFGANVLLPIPLPNGEERIELTAADIQIPEAERTFQALELTFDRPFDGTWSLQGSAVFSKSEGNFEGALKSDTGQTDAGIVSDFDFLVFIPGQFGLLPNHRGYQFKLFGSYAVTEDFLLGGNLFVVSPRKYGCIGLAPPGFLDADVANASYGVENARFCGGKVVQRGSAFETDWITRFDMSARYTVPETFFPRGNLVLRADIFNLFNLQGVQEANEFGEFEGGDPDPNYGAPTAYQPPRTVRIGFDLEF